MSDNTLEATTLVIVSEALDDFTEEQGERSRENIKTMEIRHLGSSNVTMMADYW